MNDLLFIPNENIDAKLRLICFSYAGGSSDIYLPWLDHINTEAELVVCQLPGRTTRIDEQPYLDMASLISDLIEAITPLINKPLILFGHSFGAKIAYELAVAMEDNNLPAPLHFIVSACGAPFIQRLRPPINQLPDALFIVALSRLNGTPLSVLNNSEVIKLYLPALRADFRIVENYINDRKVLINAPLTIIGGTKDTVITQEDLLAWQNLIDFKHQQTCEIEWVDGEHFYIKSHSKSVLILINQLICRHFK